PARRDPGTDRTGAVRAGRDALPPRARGPVHDPRRSGRRGPVAHRPGPHADRLPAGPRRRRGRPPAPAAAALSPLATLERGYAVVQGADGTIIRSPDQPEIGQALSVRVAGGRFGAERTGSDPYIPPPQPAEPAQPSPSVPSDPAPPSPSDPTEEPR